MVVRDRDKGRGGDTRGGASSHDHRDRRALLGQRRLAVSRSAARRERDLYVSFLRVAHFHASGRDVGRHVLAFFAWSSLPFDAGECAGRGEVVGRSCFRLRVIRYGTDRWNAERIDSEIGQAADWARRWGVTVICNEFGVYIKVADPAQRAQWLTDVRTALEKHGIGWAMWDYDGGFNVVTRTNGVATPDAVTVKALGLTLPAAVSVPASGADKVVKP